MIWPFWQNRNLIKQGLKIGRGEKEITTVVGIIWFTDLPKSGLGSIAPLPTVPMALSSGAYSITASQVRHKEPHAHVTICQKSQKDEDTLAEKHKLPKKENRKNASHNFLGPFSTVYILGE